MWLRAPDCASVRPPLALLLAQPLSPTTNPPLPPPPHARSTFRPPPPLLRRQESHGGFVYLALELCAMTLAEAVARIRRQLERQTERQPPPAQAGAAAALASNHPPLAAAAAAPPVGLLAGPVPAPVARALRDVAEVRTGWPEHESRPKDLAGPLCCAFPLTG